MNWIDKAAPKTKGQVGRPPLKDGERRVQIRPTVSKKSETFLNSQNEASGRVIDKALEMYEDKLNYDSRG